MNRKRKQTSKVEHIVRVQTKDKSKYNIYKRDGVPAKVQKAMIVQGD